jgi:SAM-dependent methyltransferase
MPKLHEDPWQSKIQPVLDRFNREYRREAFDLPDEVQTMPIFQEWIAGGLATKLSAPFWELVQPQKKQRCLDVGCGVSFLIYPWRDWDAFFYGQEISSFARDTLNSRAPQLNSKLFKGVTLGAAHQLQYEADQFDLVLATGFSGYYSLDYWQLVLAEAKRVLKPNGILVFDVINPAVEWVENWAILETYLGAEVMLHDLGDWQECVKTAGGKVVKQLDREILQLWKVTF